MAESANQSGTTTQAPAGAPTAGPLAPHPANQGNNRGGQGNNRGGQGGRQGGRRNDSPATPSPYEELVINIDRVARVVKGGRRFRFKALVVVGDRKGGVGVGVAKGLDVQAAVSKATDVAKKSMIKVPIENSTIPHDVEVKLSGAHVLLKPASLGTGIIAGGVVRSIIGVTGINNMLSKSLGSTNKVNIAYATIEALRALVPKDQWLTTKIKQEKK